MRRFVAPRVADVQGAEMFSKLVRDEKSSVGHDGITLLQQLVHSTNRGQLHISYSPVVPPRDETDRTRRADPDEKLHSPSPFVAGIRCDG